MNTWGAIAIGFISCLVVEGVSVGAWVLFMNWMFSREQRPDK